MIAKNPCNGVRCVKTLRHLHTQTVDNVHLLLYPLVPVPGTILNTVQ
jgi:hypothetical protein